MGVLAKIIFDLSFSFSLWGEPVHSHRFNTAFCGNVLDLQLQLWPDDSSGPSALHFLFLWAISTWMPSTIWSLLQWISQSFHPWFYISPESRKQFTSPGLLWFPFITRISSLVITTISRANQASSSSLMPWNMAQYFFWVLLFLAKALIWALGS